MRFERISEACIYRPLYIGPVHDEFEVSAFEDIAWLRSQHFCRQANGVACTHPQMRVKLPNDCQSNDGRVRQLPCYATPH